MSEETNEQTPGAEAASSPDPTPPGETTSDERTMALLAHLLGIFTWFIGALVIWLIKKDSSEFVDDQGKEALNFQITVTIAWIIAAASVVVGIGCILAPAVQIANLVFCILACVEANKGKRYRYPIAIRFIK